MREVPIPAHISILFVEQEVSRATRSYLGDRLYTMTGYRRRHDRP